jgi:Flp pilus assembly protein TadG
LPLPFSHFKVVRGQSEGESSVSRVFEECSTLHSLLTRIARTDVVGRDSGQSLVELALALPLLLLLLLGLADFGRAFYYTTIISNAARAGAAYLSQNPTAGQQPATSLSSVKAKVCNETGLFAYNDVASCTLTVRPPGAADFTGYGNGQDAVVSVTYDFRLVSSYLVGRAIASDPLPLTAQATYPGLR